MQTLTIDAHLFEAGEPVPNWVCRIEGAPQSDFTFSRRVLVLPFEGRMQLLNVGDENAETPFVTVSGHHDFVQITGAPTSFPRVTPRDQQIIPFLHRVGADVGTGRPNRAARRSASRLRA